MVQFRIKGIGFHACRTNTEPSRLTDTKRSLSIAANQHDPIRCSYLSGRDKVVFTDGKAVGVRRDLNGILLLDTALQTPVAKPDDRVRVELSLPEVSELSFLSLQASLSVEQLFTRCAASVCMGVGGWMHVYMRTETCKFLTAVNSYYQPLAVDSFDRVRGWSQKS